MNSTWRYARQRAWGLLPLCLTRGRGIKPRGRRIGVREGSRHFRTKLKLFVLISGHTTDMKRHCFLTIQFNKLFHAKCGYHLQSSSGNTCPPQCYQAEWTWTVHRGKAIHPHHSEKERASLPTITAIKFHFLMKCKNYSEIMTFIL